MGIFNNSVEINQEEPFKHDKLCRRSEIENLTKLFEITDSQMVLAVNSPWGAGKTTFFELWRAYLKSNNELKSKYEVIYFNAWENDDCLDPLVSIMGEMKESIEKVNKTNWDNIKEKGKKIVKKLTPVVIKVATAGLVSSNDVHLDDKVKDSIIDVSGNLFDVDEYIEQKEIRKEFEKELKEYQEKLDKTVIFFIDELDRCRPTFAIETLERVKHLFNLEKFIFILGIDKEALSNSIKVIYGTGTDINGYLARFIDMEYSLKETHREEYTKYLFEKYMKDKIEERTYENFLKVVPRIIELFNLSLRDTEKIVITLYLLLKSNRYVYEDLEVYMIPFLLILSRFDKILYSRIKNKNVKFKQLTEILNEKIDIENWFNEDKKGYVLKAKLINILYDVEAYKELEEKANEFDNMTEQNKVYGENMYRHCLRSGYNLNFSENKSSLEEHLEYITNLIDIYSNLDITQ
ncbi:hypothetical protein GSQ54_17430 [Clostridioides difficile]|uniref:KAP family P-loop NTPase fold protein n=1 Tax=Clostridioides difficile TaxID=1496 RepID=UPI00144248DB|nr:P-loop NTPase fold protein [Clostridioides difficile]NJI82207.1 hypothetical protein [Clostridioides difficile]NKN21097.1 hypothetical protein [Clostridioides difficile]